MNWRIWRVEICPISSSVPIVEIQIENAGGYSVKNIVSGNAFPDIGSVTLVDTNSLKMSIHAGLDPSNDKSTERSD